MATFTASELNPLKGLHTGENVIVSHFEGSVTVSEVILLARIPNHAIITNWRLSGGTAIDGGTGTWKVGFSPPIVDTFTGASLSEAGLHATASLTTSGLVGSDMASWSVSASIMVRTNPARIPIRVSISDDAAQQFTWIAATLSSASGTATTNMQFIVKYVLGE